MAPGVDSVRHIHRFFVAGTLDEGDRVSLEGDDSFHASSVLRLKPGDAVELADARGSVFSSTIIRTGGTVEARVERQLGAAAADSSAAPGADAAARITVVQSLPAGRKMDLVVEKLSELGVAVLVPVYSDGSVARGGISDTRQRRWERIARTAAAQSRRNRIMEIARPQKLAEWLDDYYGSLVALVTEADGVPLGEAVEALEGDLALLIGPEAGFSEAEIGRLRERDAVLASLGPMLLRTETAALVAAAIVMHRKGLMG